MVDKLMVKKMKLKIYLADLTYDTISITSDVFPLNIALVASYCKKIIW